MLGNDEILLPEIWHNSKEDIITLLQKENGFAKFHVITVALPMRNIFNKWMKTRPLGMFHLDMKNLDISLWDEKLICFTLRWKTHKFYFHMKNLYVSLWDEKLGCFFSFTFFSLTFPAFEFNLWKPGWVCITVKAELFPLAPAKNAKKDKEIKGNQKQNNADFFSIAPLPLPFLISPKLFAHEGEAGLLAAVNCFRSWNQPLQALMMKLPWGIF